MTNLQPQGKAQADERNGLFNCCRMRTTFPRNLLMMDFMIIQGINNESDVILKKHGVRSFKPVNAFRHRQWPQYVLLGCRIKFSEAKQFIDAMYELERNMLLLGYQDYEEACAAIFEEAGSETLPDPGLDCVG